MLAGAGVALAASWFGLEMGGVSAAAAGYLVGVPALAAVPAWLSRRSAQRSQDALGRATDRERVLGELSGGLLLASDAAEVHRLAVRAAAALLTGCPGARISVAEVVEDEPDTLLVTEAVGVGADQVLGSRVPAAAIPAALATRVAGGEVVTGAILTELGVVGLEGEDDRPITVLPLINGARFFGVLCVSADGELPLELRIAFEALGTQVSLALDSVAQSAELTRRAMHDGLTGLGNRGLLHDRLTAALARSRRTGRPVAALLLDLNGFKHVNDAHGHEVGDRLLEVVADRLRQSVRVEDTVGRFGGDEFVVLAEDLHSARDALVIADRIIAAMNEPVIVGRARIRVPAGIGIALSHSETSGPDELLRLADTAMNTAKTRGGGYHLHGAMLLS